MQQQQQQQDPPEVVELLDTTSEEESLEDDDQQEQPQQQQKQQEEAKAVGNNKQEQAAESHSSSSDSPSHNHDDDDSHSTASSTTTAPRSHSHSPSILPALFREAGWDSPGDYDHDDHDSLDSIDRQFRNDKHERRLMRRLQFQIQQAEERDVLQAIEDKIEAQEQRELVLLQQQPSLEEQEREPVVTTQQPQREMPEEDDILNSIQANIEAQEQRDLREQQEQDERVAEPGKNAAPASNVAEIGLSEDETESSKEQETLSLAAINDDDDANEGPPPEVLALLPQQQASSSRPNQGAKVLHSEIAWFSPHPKRQQQQYQQQQYQIMASTTPATTTDPYAALNARDVRIMATTQRRKRRRSPQTTLSNAKPRNDLSDTESESNDDDHTIGTNPEEDPRAGCNDWQVREAARRLATFFTTTPLVRATHTLPRTYMDAILKNFVGLKHDDTTTSRPILVARYEANDNDDFQRFLWDHPVLRTYQRSLLLEEFQAELYTVVATTTTTPTTRRGRDGASINGSNNHESLQLRLRGRRPIVAGMGEWCAWQIQQAVVAQAMRSLLGDPQRYEMTVRLPYAILAVEALHYNNDNKVGVLSHKRNNGSKHQQQQRGQPILVPQPGHASYPYYWIDQKRLDQENPRDNPLLKAFLNSLLGTEIMNQPGLAMALQGFEFTNRNHQRMRLSNIDYGNGELTNYTTSTTTRIRVSQSNLEEDRRTVHATLVVSSFVNVTTALALKRKVKSASRLLVEGTSLRRPGLSESAAEEAKLDDMGQQKDVPEDAIVANHNSGVEPRPVDTIHLHPLEETGDADTIISEITIRGIHSDKHEKTHSSRLGANKQFKAKFRDVYLIEYQRCEITYAFCMSQMWAAHKKHFGSKSCDDDCPCAVYVADLTENIVGQFLDKQLRDAPAGWTVPKGLQDRDESPVGFVNHFGTFSLG